MAWLEDLAKGASSPSGLMVGIGTLVLTPVLLPAVSRVARPVAKAALAAGIATYRRVAEPLGDTLTELVTEARLEMATQPEGGQSGEHKQQARHAKPHRSGGEHAKSSG